MIKNFPVTKDLFRDEFINKAKGIWIIFENWNWEKTKESQQETQKTEDAPVQVEDNVRIAFEKKADWFLNNIKIFDWEWFVLIMKLAWYEVDNENYAAKCFNNLYKDNKIKTTFLKEIKYKIFKIEKETWKNTDSYWKIRLHNRKWYRILFLKNNKTIDGIYNHDDYLQRKNLLLWS